MQPILEYFTILQIVNAFVFLLGVAGLVSNQFIRLDKTKSPLFSSFLLVSWGIGNMLHACYLLYHPKFKPLQNSFYTEGLYGYIFIIGLVVVFTAHYFKTENEWKKGVFLQLVFTLMIAVIVLVTQQLLGLPIQSLSSWLFMYGSGILLAKNIYLLVDHFLKRQRKLQPKPLIYFVYTALGLTLAMILTYIFQRFALTIILNSVGAMGIDLAFGLFNVAAIGFNLYIFGFRKTIDSPIVSFFLHAIMIFSTMIALISAENYSGIIVSILVVKFFFYLTHGISIQLIRKGEKKKKASITQFLV